MEKNTLWAAVLSMLFLMIWWMYFQKPVPPTTPPAPQPAAAVPKAVAAKPQALTTELGAAAQQANEQEVTVESPKYKAVFTTRGAAVKHWYLKEANGTLTDLVLGNDAQLATFPGSIYTVTQNDRTVTFKHVSPQGWRIVKTYDLSADYLHTVSISLAKTNPAAQLPAVQFDWGPGLGTEQKEQKENVSLTRALGYTAAKPHELKKFKPGEYTARDLRWAAIDNRYFLAAFIPAEQNPFATVAVYRESKKQPSGITLTAPAPAAGAAGQDLSVQLYLGPKGLSHLKQLNLRLEETIDFGFFGFLGKIALDVLLFFYKMTHNYGWAIIILTVIIQIIVLPLTIKSFKASVAMKNLQPLIKNLQDKYKSDPKRLNVEMMNLYRAQKVNPFGGCLPMLLQLPIFWALFTTLRNAFELRGAPWILWVRDLSAPDTLVRLGGIPINILPLIMGVGMLLQQKMMTATSDPTQQKMMYLMPVIFTFMFWGFPSGLVLYWLTNSVATIIEQYVIMRQQEAPAA
jgi:YidC/Oxa1 family membrane protein insertase